MIPFVDLSITETTFVKEEFEIKLAVSNAVLEFWWLEKSKSVSFLDDLIE